jgi:MscS family membrane protein
MDRFLDYVILDNTVRSYLVVAGVILLTFIFKRYLSRYIAGLLFRLVHRIARGVDKQSFVRLVVSPLETFLLLLISIISIDKLIFPSVLDVTIYRIRLHEFMDGASVTVLIISFIWLLLRMIDFIAIILNQKAEKPADLSDHQLVVFFKDLFKVLFVIMGILMILKMAFHYKISNLITALSIGSAAIALSFRESLENLIASFIIFFDKPFVIGDLVKVHDITGTVERIGLRSTRIRTDQKTFVTVPNKQMVDSIMDNLSLRTQRRAFVQLELHSETPHDTVNQFVQRVRNLLQERKDQVENFTVFLSDINKNAFVMHVEFFTAPIPIADFNNIRQEVNLSIIELMEEMNIRLASKEAENTSRMV